MNYLKIYIKIIKKAKSEKRSKGGEIYYEKHHIKPKSLYPEFENCKWNHVLLTAKEHYICHWLLAKIFGNTMWHAFWAMNQQISKRSRYVSSYGYKTCKEEYHNYMKSDLNPQKLNPHNKGVSKSPEHRKKLSESTKNGKKLECPHCKKLFHASGLQCHLNGVSCEVRDSKKPSMKGVGKGNYNHSPRGPEYSKKMSELAKQKWKEIKENGKG